MNLLVLVYERTRFIENKQEDMTDLSLAVIVCILLFHTTIGANLNKKQSGNLSRFIFIEILFML